MTEPARISVQNQMRLFLDSPEGEGNHPKLRDLYELVNKAHAYGALMDSSCVVIRDRYIEIHWNIEPQQPMKRALTPVQNEGA